jgi:hypothetical protein
MCKPVFLSCVGSGISLTNIYLSVCFLHNEVNKCVTCAAAHILASVQRPCSERSQRLDLRHRLAACSAELEEWSGEEDMIHALMEAAIGIPYHLTWQVARGIAFVLDHTSSLKSQQSSQVDALVNSGCLFGPPPNTNIN